jgi:hypothetical protein
MLEPVVNAALAGQVTHVNNAEMYLMRGGYLEECYFTWSMMPVFNDSQKAVGLYIVSGGRRTYLSIFPHADILPTRY